MTPPLTPPLEGEGPGERSIKQNDDTIVDKLIEAHEGLALANHLDQFSAAKRKAIALKLIKAHEGEAVAKNLDKFSDADRKKIEHQLNDIKSDTAK